MQLTDSTRKVIYEAFNKHEDKHAFTAHAQGQHTACFKNIVLMGMLVLTHTLALQRDMCCRRL